MITKLTERIFLCDDCSEKAIFRCDSEARAAGWAIARDRTTCYCKKCAPYHRHNGLRAAQYHDQGSVIFPKE